MLSSWVSLTRQPLRQGLLTRLFCSPKSLNWLSGTDAIAQSLFETHTTGVPDGVRACDPRGMKTSELKRRLGSVSSFNDDMTKASKFSDVVISRWQYLYNDWVNRGAKLPGKEKAGPLTFHKESDAGNVRDLYDKNGRVQH